MDVSNDTVEDVSALAWVQDELRKSLDAAHKALRRTLKDTESTYDSDLDDVDPAQLRAARQQLHQGVGVLELVGLPAAATLLRASEAAVQRFVGKPHKIDMAAVEAIERASFALLDYLARRLAGKPVSPVALFPQYKDVQEVAGAERIHPADLWPQDWQWRLIAGDDGVAPRGADASLTAEFEAQALKLMRSPGAEVTRRLGELSAGLAAGAAGGAEASPAATLWHLATAFFEAQTEGLLVPDVYAKRVTSRLLAQLRGQQRGDAGGSERLAQDLLFFCAQVAEPLPPNAPRLAALRRAYPPTRDTIPAGYLEVQLGRHDPTRVAQARKRVAAAKDSWSAVAGGEMHRLPGLNEQFTLVAESLRRLVPGGEALAEALSRAVAQTVMTSAAPAPTLAMEVATSVLYLEAALEEGAFDQASQAPRVQRLAQRIGAVQGGAEPEPLEAWMEELYRRVSDRQTMGSVVQELRAALSESEKLIDQFFRAPADPAVMIPVPAQLQAMRGVMSVLGLEQASHTVLRMRDDVDALVAAGEQARHQQPLFERLAGNLSALSFLIDLLGVQPQIAKTMFRFDAASGLLGSQLLRHDSPLEAAAAPRLEPALIAQVQQLADGASGSMPLEEVAREIDRLALTPEVAAQPELAASLSGAQAMLGDASSPEAEAAVREIVAGALVDFVATASDPVGLDKPAEPVSAPMPLMSIAPPAPVQATGLEGDEEMREIFLEEAREVLGTARGALDALREAADDVEQLTTVRRAFHTLKGSSRMVGLSDFGEAAWSCEQLYNAWLASQSPASADLLGCSDEALQHLGAWVEAIAAGNVAGWHSGPLRRVVDALRLDGQRLRLEAAAPDAAQAAPVTSARPEPLPMVPLSFVLPPASDLDLPPAAAGPAPAIVAPEPALPGLDFSFKLDDEPVAEAAAPAAPPAEPAGTNEPLLLRFIDELDSRAAAQAASVLDVPFEPEAAASPEATEHAATAPMALDELPGPPPTDGDETIITSFDLDVPGGAATLAAAFAPHVVEPLVPSVPVAPAFEGLPPAPASEDGDAGGAAEADEALAGRAHELLPFIVSDIVAPLQPSAPTPEPVAVDTAAESAPEAANDDAATRDHVKQIGPLRIGIPLFNIYLNEADELSRRLGTELSEWSLELHRPVGESVVALAHSLAGSSATVGFIELSALARQLEHALMRSRDLGRGRSDDAQLFLAVADEIRRLLHQFAAGFLKSPPAALLDELAVQEREMLQRLDALAAAPADDGESLEEAPAPAEPPPEPSAAAPIPITAAAPAAADTDHAPSAFADFGQAEFKPFVPRAAGPARPAAATPVLALDSDEDIDAVDAVDPDLFGFFEEEAQELLPVLSASLRDWMGDPAQTAHAAASMRTLHTLKGGARLAGAMRLGELSHRLETAIEHLLAHAAATAPEVEQLLGRADALSVVLEQLRQQDAQAYAAAQDAALRPLVDSPEARVVSTAWPPLDEASAPLPLDASPVTLPPPVAAAPPMAEPEAAAPPVAAPLPRPAAGEIDWSRFAPGSAAAPRPTERMAQTSAAAVRVRTQLLDRMVNQAGEVSITRARLESEVGQIKGSLGDLTENLERLRQQLRDIELQAETQMSTRMEAAKASSQGFDPLEFDRFTRFQELTRMMAESVNDVATVQRTLQRTLETTEDELAAQARLTRDLQDDLLRTRMVEFEGLSERLYRVVRQAAKETGKQVRLDIVGGSIEVDRGVLDRMTGAFEHLLRNCVTHGIETPERRIAAGKEPVGDIVVALHQEGNEVSVEFRDDGAGLNLLRIRDKGVAMGLIDAHASPSDADLANLIFTPGFSTADAVTELSGRGVGMDVVRSEVNALGGRIETASAHGQGSSFKLVLPLTTAVTQIVMLRVGGANVAVPATLVEIVKRATPAEVEAAYASGAALHGGQTLPFFWLGSLLQLSPRSAEPAGRTRPLLVMRSAAQRVVLHVDEVLGNQEVVVKNLGPQLSRLPGLAGMTLLASGAAALIYNPVALATVYADQARRATAAALRAAPAQAERIEPAAAEARAAPLVLVVDDSLTVRRVTQRLLVREGYRVTLAKDGLDALEKLAEERPAVVLSDIEMPRMDGFDLVRNLRGDSRLAALPVIMITSRIAQKHRDYARELGVNHYLGKPYSEEELLALIGRYCAEAAAAS